ncbi:transglycosylase SLT domain-containing protein [Ferrimonas pelagia]|uniref:Transglycosylase SLT domain-containing protein n=1 Tax=Ferrimonas pelagia TaxID=1177826 RepID=A0ABP9FC06_9GAMM
MAQFTRLASRQHLLAKSVVAVAVAAFSLPCTALAATTPQSEWQEFLQYRQQQLSEFEQYRNAYLKAYDAYRSEILALWDEAPVSDAHNLVQYSEDKTLRSEIDFANDEIRISVIHAPDNAPDQEQVQQQISALLQAKIGEVQQADPLQQAVELGSIPLPSELAQQPLLPRLASDTSTQIEAVSARLMEQAKRNTRVRDYTQQRMLQMQQEVDDQQRAALQELEKQEDLKQLAEPLSQDLAATRSGVPLLPPGPSLESKTQALTEQGKERKAALAQAYTEQQSDPTEKQITTFRIQLPQHSLQKKAQPFLGIAHAQSNEWEVPLDLVLAIMHAESSFNPLARSHVPAFGLMQIVPSSAGKDVRQHFEQSQIAPKPDELYQADFNIRFGSAYLNILDKRYLKGITDPESRLYCVIAAYNTGAGNVAKAFNTDRSRRLKTALPRINSMSPTQVYKHLVEHLPYDETRKYLKKVSKYQQNYAEISKELVL